jgi:hypothetical protein
MSIGRVRIEACIIGDVDYVGAVRGDAVDVLANSGPTVSTTTSPPSPSRSSMARTRAHTSSELTSHATPSRWSLRVAESKRKAASTGTCFTRTTMLMPALRPAHSTISTGTGIKFQVNTDPGTGRLRIVRRAKPRPVHT